MSSSEERREAIKRSMVASIPYIGNHKHHAACIHNLPPEEQVTARGRTVEWWLKWCGELPRQITPSEQGQVRSMSDRTETVLADNRRWRNT